MRFRLGRRTWLVTLLAIVLVSLTALPAAAKYPGTNGQIAFTHYDDAGSHVFIADPDGGNPKQLPADNADLAVWSPGGSQILLTICCSVAPPSQQNHDRATTTAPCQNKKPSGERPERRG